MGSPYTIAVDASRGLIRATLRGMWDLGVLAGYTAELQATFARLSASVPPGQPLELLIDLRQHGVQPREVGEAIQAELARADVAAAARTAVLVSPSALHRLQAQRLGSHLAASFFADEAEALAWLDAA